HGHASSGDALAGPIFAEDLDPSLVRRDQAGDRPKGRGLADGARAEQHEEAAFRHGQGEVFQGPNAAIRLAQLDQAQCGIIELAHRHSSGHNHGKRWWAANITRRPPEDADASVRYANAWRALPRVRRRMKATPEASRAPQAPPPSPGRDTSGGRCGNGCEDARADRGSARCPRSP